MTKFGLSITSNDLVVVGLGEPLFLLFWSALTFKCDLLA